MNRRSFSLLCAVLSSACLVQDAGPKARPDGVPQGAFWCGGADGGVFVQIARKGKSARYEGTLYTDFDGDVLYRGELRADPKNPAKKLPRRGDAWCAGWDGTRLWLAEGGALLAVDAERQVFRPK